MPSYEFKISQVETDLTSVVTTEVKSISIKLYLFLMQFTIFTSNMIKFTLEALVKSSSSVNRLGSIVWLPKCLLK